MARMMPAFCPADAPPGEKSIYTALQECGNTSGWIVLHSLAIAEHVRQVEGEADFVVIVPNTGILVIETKSHLSIERRTDGTWKLGNEAPTARGPFEQARQAMYSLRTYLHKRNVDLRSIPVLYAVWFTGVRARTMLPSNPEWHDWQVLDSEDLRSASGAILRTLAAGTKHLDAKVKHLTHGGIRLGAEQAGRIAGLLRPRFELATVAGDRRRDRESQLFSFVEEQFLALDAASDNRGVIFSGPAGSGKTFLAMESARRESETGNRGRLMCFNRFLGKRLQTEMSSLSGLTVGTFHQELMRLAGIDQIPEDPSPSFWEDELPERAIEAIIDSNDDLTSDFLIVDEIQDIATDQYLDVLELMVKGGLKEGRVLLFGDFERQAIYGNEAGRERLRARAPYLASHKLLHNCRNLPRIGYQVNLLGRLEPGYQQFRRIDDGVDPSFHPYSAGEDQSAKLVAAIRALREDGFALHEIVVLSPLRSGATAATTRDPWLKQILRPADGLSARPGEVQYSTIQAFKGLEAPAVVLTDLDENFTIRNFDSVFYIGLTRATDRLIALIERNTFRKALGGNA